jgi:hypothetical protein
MLQYNYGFWDQWLNPQPVTFDGANKLIIVNPGVTTLTFASDVYSNWKEWVSHKGNRNWLPAIDVIGGNPLPGGDRLGTTFFLKNGWRMRTWEGDHRLKLIGNVYTDTGDNLFVNTLNPHNIEITLTVSSLSVAVAPTTAVVNEITSGFAQATATKIWDTPVEIAEANPGTIGEYIGKKMLSITRFLSFSK